MIYTNDKDSVVDRSIASRYKILYFDSLQNRSIKEIYSIDGVLLFKISYLSDVKDGLYTAYYSNGNPSDSGFFKADSRFGRWKNYHTNGKLASIPYYNGYSSLPVSCDSCWDEIGNIQKCIRSEGPLFIGGNEALYSFISKHIKYPKEAKSNGISGKVIISAVIDCFGNVTKPQIYKSVDKNLDDEALRVVKMLPNWKPAIFFNKPITGYVNIPVDFIL
ncbi:MAG: TonB family protein [Chitinophagales bacterium]